MRGPIVTSHEDRADDGIAMVGIRPGQGRDVIAFQQTADDIRGFSGGKKPTAVPCL
jgi:hypothetical protein